MGFTAVDGLPMGTRCGAIDPGVLLYLMDERGMDARAIEKLLYNQSGLLGVSGHLERHARAARVATIRGAKLAVDLFVYRIGRELGSLAAALGGLDALVFTAGIGENAAPIRERVCRDAAWLGVEARRGGERAAAVRASAPPHSRIAAWVDPDQRGADDRAPHARPARGGMTVADPASLPPVLAGKKALVVGIANDHSIAYGCARAMREPAPTSRSPT